MVKLQKVNYDKAFQDLDFDREDSFISYYYQYRLIRKYLPKNILEIGIGNKTLSTYLKTKGFNVTLCDYDPGLKPDVTTDIRDLPFKDNHFDLIACFEILEHIPFCDFEKTIKEITRISKKHIVISIPYPTINLACHLKIPKLKPFNFLWRITEQFFIKHKFDGGHYWEMGKKGYSRKLIRQIFYRNNLRIEEEFSSNLNPYHYFFVLTKY